MINKKEEQLIQILEGGKSYAVAFSGGTDSTLLLYYLSKLKIKTKAYTFHSYLYPEKELEEATNLAKLLGIDHEIILLDPLEKIDNIKYNPKERCYICKKYMFNILKEKAALLGIEKVIEGSNFDDRNDFRPGMKAVKELNIISPLDMAELTKDDVRYLLKKANLNYKKPSFACYFSRFPYNMDINKHMIERISLCESYIHSLGFDSIRVRYHYDIVRLEGNIIHIKTIINDDIIRHKIIDYIKSHGFLFVTLDLEEYKTGSMNRTIK